MSLPELFDTHCHVVPRVYGEEVDAVIARAREAGVRHLCIVGAGYGVAGNAEALRVAEEHADAWAIVGVHPHDAAEVGPGTWGEIAAHAAHPKVVALGEMGLDYHYDRSPRDVQLRVFREQLSLARDLDLPVVVHTREADDDTLALLDEAGPYPRGVLIHCFSGTPEFARALVSRGALLSIPGIVTFRNAEGLRQGVLDTPLEQLLLETDSPFLAPVPHRGRRNEPAFVVEVAAAVAAVKGFAPADVARATTLTARRFFGLEDPGEREGQVAYRIRRSLYLNVTSRCTLACTFCPKFRTYEVTGVYLKLPSTAEPTADEVLAAARVAAVRDTAGRSEARAALADPSGLPDLSGFDEVVFVGYGEPTRRLDLVLEVARRAKEELGAKRTRLDTDGLASLREGRDVTPEIAAVFDAVSVSLNAQDAVTYARVCPNRYGEAAWPAVKAFIAAAVGVIPWVQATAVGVPGVDPEACRAIADGELGARFRFRPFQHLG
ncbi:YchF/TatD family DNA exonuclease [Myxococcota bacterium]|nr:YchF/TatD family DNA exonuclease [Myxococcota bacterium]